MKSLTKFALIVFSMFNSNLAFSQEHSCVSISRISCNTVETSSSGDREFGFVSTCQVAINIKRSDDSKVESIILSKKAYRTKEKIWDTSIGLESEATEALKIDLFQYQSYKKCSDNSDIRAD